MEPTSVTVETLRGIRDEARKTNERVDVLATEVKGLATQTNALATQTNALATQTDALATQTGALATQTNALATQTDALATQTDALATQTKGLAAQINGLGTQTKGLGTEIKGLATETREGFAAVADRIERVERRQTETEMRLATELVGVAGAVREVRDLLRDDLALRHRVEDHERRIAAIEKHPE